MLTLLRNLLRSKIALLIIGLLIVAMASFGITDIFAPNLGSSLVAVGNRTVEANDVERDADSYLNRLSDSGTYLTKQDLAEGGQLQAILDQLVSRNLLAAYLQDQGIVTSEEELIAYIRQLPIFRNAVTQGFSQDSGFPQAVSLTCGPTWCWRSPPCYPRLLRPQLRPASLVPQLLPLGQTTSGSAVALQTTNWPRRCNEQLFL